MCSGADRTRPVACRSIDAGMRGQHARRAWKGSRLRTLVALKAVDRVVLQHGVHPLIVLLVVPIVVVAVLWIYAANSNTTTSRQRRGTAAAGPVVQPATAAAARLASVVWQADSLTARAIMCVIIRRGVRNCITLCPTYPLLLNHQPRRLQSAPLRPHHPHENQRCRVWPC